MSNENPVVLSRGNRYQQLHEGDEISLREVYDLLKAGRWTILKVAAGVFFLGLCLCFLWPPTFHSTGIIQVDDLSKNTTGVAGRKTISSILLGTPVQTAGEIEILQSRRVLDPVIKEMNLEIVSYPNHFPIIGSGIARFINGSDKQPAGALWGFGRWAWGGEQLVVDSMEVPFNWLDSSATLIATDNGFRLTNFWGTELLHGRVGEEASSSDGRFKILVSTLRARPGTHFSVTKYSHDDTVQNLLKAMDIAELATSSGVVGITFGAPTREQARDFVNNLQTSYLLQNVEKHSASATGSKDLLEKQLPQLRDQMLAAQQKLSDYESDHGSPNVSAETQILLQNSVTLQTKRLELQTELDKARQQFGPENAKIKELTQAIASVTREQGSLSSHINTLPPTQQDVLSLTRDVKAYTQLYNAMNASIQNYQVAQASSVSNVRIVDQASEPYKPYFPQMLLILLLSVPLGLFLGVVWVFTQRALLRGMDNPTEIENTSGVVTHSIIPFSKQQHSLRRRSKRKSGSKILALIEPDDAAIQTLRALCTSHSHNNTIMLCGPASGVGKTFVTVNLGVLLAQSGKRTVLVDADLRRGKLHGYFGADAVPGVTDIVLGTSVPEPLVRHSDVQGLDYVTCGSRKPGSTEILRHARFAELIQLLSSKYDCVLVAAPPVLAVPDAAIIGRMVNATLLVLGSAQHRPNEIQDAFKRLSAAGVSVSGALLNRVGEKAGSYGYRGYGYGRHQYS